MYYYSQLGYVTDQEANVINMAIGLHDMDNLHGTSFYRSENYVLFITYKLKQNMSIQEIDEWLHKFFWFDKVSKAGNFDTISGQVVHPPMGENNQETDDNAGYSKSGIQSGNLDDTKEVKIDGCNYELGESEITDWLEHYGTIKSELEEIATAGDTDGPPIGTGSYTLKMKLNRLIPNVLPMHGLKVKCSYQGVKKQCGNCYDYHKPEKEFKCANKSFNEYKETFTKNNHDIPLRMLGLAIEDDYTIDDNISETEDINGENKDEINEEEPYFNYNYSYDFVPDWTHNEKA